MDARPVPMARLAKAALDSDAEDAVEDTGAALDVILQLAADALRAIDDL